MYLKDGREIYESDKFPGYYIEANTGNFCDVNGNYIGGNINNGDTPGSKSVIFDVTDIVYISKTGKQYYPTPTKSATIPISLDAAHEKKLKPSAGYDKFVKKLYKKYMREKARRAIEKLKRRNNG